MFTTLRKESLTFFLSETRNVHSFLLSSHCTLLILIKTNNPSHQKSLRTFHGEFGEERTPNLTQEFPQMLKGTSPIALELISSEIM